jgi:predicted amidohydrolase
MGQMRVIGGDKSVNLDRAEGTIAEASKEGCQVIVLPECLDLGWTHPSAHKLSDEIPGEMSDRLCGAARRNNTMVLAGLTEREDKKIYDSAILIDSSGKILLKHRKINLLDIEQDLYDVGTFLSVVETKFGNIGVNICADNFESSLAIGHVLARMGAHFILSPCAWAVSADHDNKKEPYGKDWFKSYSTLSKLYGISVVGVSNVGWINAGPWKGRKTIGCSLAVGPEGKILSQGPYGVDSEALLYINLQAVSRKVKGTDYANYLLKKGYRGP